jgi:hypothetical protein
MDPDPIRIRIWILLFSSLTFSRRQQKTTVIKKSFSAYYFLKVYLHHFLKIKKAKRSHKKAKKSHKKNRTQSFSYYFCLILEGSGSIPLTCGSGSGSRRLKNMWIRWIRIRIRNYGFRPGSPLFAFVLP